MTKYITYFAYCLRTKQNNRRTMGLPHQGVGQPRLVQAWISRVSQWTYAWTTRTCLYQNNLCAVRMGGGVTLACAYLVQMSPIFNRDTPNYLTMTKYITYFAYCLRTK